MKELTNEFQDTKVEIVSEKEHKKGLKLIGKQRKVRGLTLWEYNEKTKALLPATYKKVNVMISSLGSKLDITNTHKVIVNENCVYFQALNRKNALKKLGI